MFRRSLAFLFAAALIAVPCASGQEKKAEPEKKADAKEDANAEKLVGSWEMQDSDLTKIDGKATFEFTKDGKAKMSIVIGKQDAILIEGTYKLEDKKLTLAVKKGDKDASEAVELKSVNDTELVLVDKQKKEVKFKKPEAKMPKDLFPKDSFPKSPFPKNPFPMEP
jgi:uncharacterized protein (TIGR03066 family)